MWYAALELDLLLGDVSSLKQKRSAIRPIVAELRRHGDVVAAEVGDQDLYRRAQIGVVCTASTSAYVTDALDRAERLVAERPEVTLLASRRRMHRIDDE